MQLRLVILIAALASTARADAELPSPLTVRDVIATARTNRSEIVAARASASAAAQRPAIVSALDEPTISASIDHVPFNGMGVEWSVTLEQTFPLSRIRGNRRSSAAAGARRELADVEAARLDVELEAARAFWMLAEARTTAQITGEQRTLAAQLTAAAMARYASNTGAQADVLRAEIEVARLDAERRAAAADVRAAEAMLNTSLARDVGLPIPELDVTVPDGEPPAADAVASAARRRPELRAGRADIERADADVKVMGSMYSPMAMLRTGPAYTMAEGKGWMVMVGVTIPLWRAKLRAGVDEARAMRTMATADLDATRRMVEGEATSTREQVVAARERYRALRDEIVPRATQAITPTLAAYTSGQVPLVSVVEAAQALWAAQRDVVMARTELGIAWARLRRAAGEEMTR